ncbi:MAG: NfeD family protein [Spirochaetota bacterium]
MSVWEGLALLGAGLLGIIVEVFVPAGGLIGIAGGGAIIAAVILAYTQGGTSVGVIVLAASLVLTPVIMVVAFKLFPVTPLGKRFILGTTLGSGDEEEEGSAEADGTGANVRVQVGDRGTASTVLKPTGVATIRGKRYSVLTRGEYLAAGTELEVIRVEGNRILVREA